MKNYCIDVGNTFTKLGVFEAGELRSVKSVDNLKSLKSLINGDLDVAKNYIVSSVGADSLQISKELELDLSRLHHLKWNMPLPIKLEYETPNTLGADRIASACGAKKLFPDSNLLVIDAGTCITYDFIDSQGSFWGGGISPGLSLRAKALHNFTSRLPMVEISSEPKLVGTSTKTAIESGVFNGFKAEIKGIISEYRKKFGDLKIILCGGDSKWFDPDRDIFVIPELVLIGLDSILTYNVNQKK
ncbi:type III pantothenate kinase [Aureibacter tunicatorum]|uniref:Type III pantothenate kinase n=1 Tax=Aureibacter tunicatorum TaxID=866807 RepID=A0AAE4BPB1_9BACT|nr:type III pantothenate kinase [Aureibacter tunicatorum]MDR6237774.1 type III pantothenate kinase [Aureibacter tunicatorum]BDD02809.1 type III pantothenate kinase [Aureibacter tunicatorum]